jgi:hypothetical protein
MGLTQSTEHSQAKEQYEYQPEDYPWIYAIREVEVLDWKNGLDPEEILQQNHIQDNLPAHIYGRVYLGDATSVQDIAKLKQLGINRVLNMAGPLALKKRAVRAYEKECIEYMRITAQDEEDYPLLERHWESAYHFIHAKQQDNNEVPHHNGGNCVVHCVAGLNRSGLIVAADYMVTCQKPVLEVVRHLRKQRGNAALCNSYFQEQLVAFARKHDLLGAKPGTPNSFDFIVPSNDDSRKPPSTKVKNYKSLFSGM